MEFLEWIAYMDLDVNAFHREDYNFAQVAAEVRRSFVKEPSKVDVNDFVLQFTSASHPPHEDDPNQTLDDVKNAFAVSLGMAPRKEW